MMKKLAIPLVILALITGQAAAAPAVIDTNTAVVIVIRPSEQWTPNESMLDNYDEGMRQKHYLLNVKEPGGKFANASFYQTGWMKIAKADLASAGWESSRWLPKNFSVIGPAITMTGAEYSKVVQVQEQYYRALNIKAGSPEMQEATYNKGVFASIAVAVVTLGIGATAGVPSQLLGLSTGFVEMLGAIPPALRTAVSPNWPAAGDFSQYPTIDVRQVVPSVNRGVVGQIIIAYKEAKTPTTEEAAMAIAIRALVGVGTTLEDIQRARQEDRDRRALIWKDCVAEGKCKEEQ